MHQKSNPDWNRQARIRLNRILKAAMQFPTLARRGPSVPWTAHVELVGKARMTSLNQGFRKKAYPTDVLSFPTPAPFRLQGFIGDLVICLPVMKAQAKSLGLKPELELHVLLTHGVLHLLGYDHEEGEREAKTMARWEARVLQASLPLTQSRRLLGLIERVGSGMNKK